jgi:hypothetical protein
MASVYLDPITGEERYRGIVPCEKERAGDPLPPPHRPGQKYQISRCGPTGIYFKPRPTIFEFIGEIIGNIFA